jgi:hypothetical protein
MHSLVEALTDMTERMVAQIDHVTEDQILFFIEQREQIVQQMQQMDISEVEISQFGGTIRTILKHDPVIIGKLEMLRNEASEGIQKVNLAKMHNNAYTAPYTPDSYYFDKKK